MSTPVIRCKVVVESVETTNPTATPGDEIVKMRAVYEGSEENKEWSKYTPSAFFQMQISNPSAQGRLAKGAEFYVDFTPADA